MSDIELESDAMDICPDLDKSLRSMDRKGLKEIDIEMESGSGKINSSAADLMTMVNIGRDSFTLERQKLETAPVEFIVL